MEEFDVRCSSDGRSGAGRGSHAVGVRWWRRRRETDAATGTDAGGDSGELVFTSSDAFKFDPAAATVKAGEVHIKHENEGGTIHTFVIDAVGFKLTDDDEGEVELAAGEYEFYCDVPGHREAGMEGTLTATP